jgi:hypothetical protein
LQGKYKCHWCIKIDSNSKYIFVLVTPCKYFSMLGMIVIYKDTISICKVINCIK